MKRILITIDDDVYGELRSHAQVRGLVQASYGISDAFVVKLVESIEAGLEEKHFHFRNAPENEAT